MGDKQQRKGNELLITLQIIKHQQTDGFDKKKAKSYVKIKFYVEI
jgi:hypothetical protein